ETAKGCSPETLVVASALVFAGAVAVAAADPGALGSRYAGAMDLDPRAARAACGAQGGLVACARRDDVGQRQGQHVACARRLRRRRQSRPAVRARDGRVASSRANARFDLAD